jgi:hypothetical protein
MVVPPEKVLNALRIRFAVPSFVRLPVPTTLPAKVTAEGALITNP